MSTDDTSFVDLRFRRATDRDRALLLALCAEYRLTDDQPPAALEVAAAVEAALTGDPLIHLFLIEVAEREVARCAGYLAITVGFSIEVGGRDAFLDELYVQPWARSRGIGARALAFGEQVCRELAVKRLCLEVERENPRARELYSRLGFAVHSRHLMSKRL